MKKHSLLLLTVVAVILQVGTTNICSYASVRPLHHVSGTDCTEEKESHILDGFPDTYGGDLMNLSDFFSDFGLVPSSLTLPADSAQRLPFDFKNRLRHVPSPIRRGQLCPSRLTEPDCRIAHPVNVKSFLFPRPADCYVFCLRRLLE